MWTYDGTCNHCTESQPFLALRLQISKQDDQTQLCDSFIDIQQLLSIRGLFINRFVHFHSLLSHFAECYTDCMQYKRDFKGFNAPFYRLARVVLEDSLNHNHLQYNKHLSRSDFCAI